MHLPAPDMRTEIEDLYRAYAHHRLIPDVEYCDHCVLPEEVAALHAVPLRDAPAELMGSLLMSHSTWGDRDYRYFRHFLPRMLELVAAGELTDHSFPVFLTTPLTHIRQVADPGERATGRLRRGLVGAEHRLRRRPRPADRRLRHPDRVRLAGIAAAGRLVGRVVRPAGRFRRRLRAPGGPARGAGVDRQRRPGEPAPRVAAGRGPGRGAASPHCSSCCMSWRAASAMEPDSDG